MASTNRWTNSLIGRLQWRNHSAIAGQATDGAALWHCRHWM